MYLSNKTIQQNMWLALSKVYDEVYASAQPSSCYGVAIRKTYTNDVIRADFMSFVLWENIKSDDGSTVPLLIDDDLFTVDKVLLGLLGTRLFFFLALLIFFFLPKQFVWNPRAGNQDYLMAISRSVPWRRTVRLVFYGISRNRNEVDWGY